MASSQGDVSAELKRHLAAEIIQFDRTTAIAKEVSRLLSVYEQRRELPADKEQAALVKALWQRAKKRQLPMDGETLALAQQVEVVEGEVLVPTIEVPPTETVPEGSLNLPELRQEVVALPASGGSSG